MPVTVLPESFALVDFDSDAIRALVERIATDVGLPDDLEIRVEVDETTPLGNARLQSIDPVVIQLQSGALEDAKAPRQFDPVSSSGILGLFLFEVRDRLDPAFADAPPASELSLPRATAWQTYCVGRLGRLGHRAQRQRRLYHFRNRHGFTDAADAAFAALWDGEDLSWPDIVALSDQAAAAR